jgi:hypothetical protein
MARFERRATLSSIANPETERAQATQRLAESFRTAGELGRVTYERQRVEQAKIDAAEQEFVPGAPLGNLSPTTAYGRAFNQANEAGYIAATKNAYMDRIDQLSREYASDPEGFTQMTDSYRQSMIDNLPPEIRTQVAFDFDQTRNSNLFSIRDTAAKNAIAATTAELSRTGDIYLGEVAKGARNADQKYLAYQSEEYRKNIIEPLIANGMKKEANVALANLQNAIIENTYLGEYERAEQAGTGAQFITDFMTKPPAGLSLDEVDALSTKMTTLNKRYRTLEAAKQADMTTEQELQLSKDLADIQSGRLVGQPAIDKLDGYLKKGQILRSTHTSNLAAMQKAEDELAAKQRKYQQVSQNIGTGNGAFVEQKDADEYYEEHYVPKVAATDPATRKEADINLVRNLKKVPAKMKTDLNALVASQNPDNIALAAQYADGMDDIPGLLDSTFDKNQQAMMETVVSLLPNMKPNEAVQLAQKITDPRDKARIDAITEQLKDRKYDDYQSEVKDEMDGWLWFGPDVKSFNQDQMTSEYKSTYEAFRKSGLEHSAAKNKAVKTLQRNWKEFNGYIMRYSPADFYAVNGKTDYIMKQLVKDVATETVGATPIPKDKLFLVSDEVTSREASTGKPSYRVFYETEDGGVVPMVGFRWTPDIQGEKKRIEEKNRRLLQRTDEEKQLDQVLESEALMNIK